MVNWALVRSGLEWCARITTFAALALVVSVALLMVAPIELTPDSYEPLDDYSPIDKELIPLLREEFIMTEEGVRLHVWVGGPDEGEAILFLHGFPENAYMSWRHQMLHFIKRGYKIIAPDLRGYNTSSKPAKVEDYAIGHLVADVVRLIGALDHRGRVNLVAHDWGGIISWSVLAGHADLFNKAVIVNAPHPRAYFQAPRIQLLRSWYILFFQLPHWLIQERLERNGFAFLLGWSSQFTAGSSRLTLHDLKMYQDAYGQKGATNGMLNYYRALLQYGGMPQGYPANVTVPTLVIWGKQDSALVSELAELSLKFCTNGQYVPIEDASHWVSHERPQFLSEQIEKFLTAAE